MTRDSTSSEPKRLYPLVSNQGAWQGYPMIAAAVLRGRYAEGPIRARDTMTATAPTITGVLTARPCTNSQLRFYITCINTGTARICLTPSCANCELRSIFQEGDEDGRPRSVHSNRRFG